MSFYPTIILEGFVLNKKNDIVISRLLWECIHEHLYEKI